MKMTKKELVEMLSEFKDDQVIDFIVVDGDDNYEGELYLNTYNGCVELTLELGEDCFIDIKLDKNK